MSKYKPIEKYLNDITESETRLSYQQMEEMIGIKLPESAYKHRAWWSNGKRGGSKFWLRVGWLIEKVVLGEEVRFCRQSEQTSQRRRRTVAEIAASETNQLELILNVAEIPALIRDLKHLTLDGVMTKAEFEEKKTKLLGMI